MRNTKEIIEKKIKTRLDKLGKHKKPTFLGPPSLPTPLPGQSPINNDDGWWLQIPQANLNLMCSPDGTSTWDMQNGGCTDPNY